VVGVRRTTLVKLAAITALLVAAIAGTYVAHAQVLAPMVARAAWKAWGGGLAVRVYGGFFAGCHVLIEVEVWNNGPWAIEGTLTVRVLLYDPDSEGYEVLQEWTRDISVQPGETRYYWFGPWEVPGEGIYKVEASL